MSEKLADAVDNVGFPFPTFSLISELSRSCFYNIILISRVCLTEQKANRPYHSLSSLKINNIIQCTLRKENTIEVFEPLGKWYQLTSHLAAVFSYAF